jgi:hypothetical protein
MRSGIIYNFLRCLIANVKMERLCQSLQKMERIFPNGGREDSRRRRQPSKPAEARGPRVEEGPETQKSAPNCVRRLCRAQKRAPSVPGSSGQEPGQILRVEKGRQDRAATFRAAELGRNGAAYCLNQSNRGPPVPRLLLPCYLPDKRELSPCYAPVLRATALFDQPSGNKRFS